MNVDVSCGVKILTFFQHINNSESQKQTTTQNPEAIKSINRLSYFKYIFKVQDIKKQIHIP